MGTVRKVPLGMTGAQHIFVLHWSLGLPVPASFSGPVEIIKPYPKPSAYYLNNISCRIIFVVPTRAVSL